jgi:tRNA(Arg) A34 adenosine deaminase TadA
MYDSIYTDKPYKNKKTVSFLVYKGKVISFGVNSAKTSPLQKYYRSRTDLKDVENFIDMEHSEINCLRRFDGDVKWHKVELVIISKQKDGKFRLARPCKVCMSAIKDFGIHKIYYTTKNQTFMFEEV